MTLERASKKHRNKREVELYKDMLPFSPGTHWQRLMNG